MTLGGKKMNILNLTVPTYPYFLYAGSVLYRPGDFHQNRQATGVFDLIYVERGELYLTENDIPYTVQEGEYLILNPIGRHFSHKPTTSQTLFHWLHFVHEGTYSISEKVESVRKGANSKLSGEYVQYALSDLKPSLKNIRPMYVPDRTNISLNVHRRLSESEQQDFMRIHKMLNSAMTSRYNDSYVMRSRSNSEVHFQQLFLALIELLQIQPGQEKANKLADGIMGYIVQNYYQNITLEQLSDSFNFHTAHIIRTFKKEYGVTPIEALNNVRIDKAKQLLENTSLSTTEIASKVGYSTPSYFARVFKKTVGLTPQAYRKEKDIQIFRG